jgi:hypothetical protein
VQSPGRTGLQKGTKFDEKRAENDQKAARFALPILTQKAQIAPHGPETKVWHQKSAFFVCLTKGDLT